MGKTLFLIPARGGSKGLANKNILEICSRPLIWYTIEAAKNLGGRLVVSTESSRIKAVCEKYGAEVIDRPQKLATDTASTASVVEHALGALEKRNFVPDEIVILQCTSPLRKPGHIKEALALFRKSGADSLISVCRLPKPVEWMYLLKENGELESYLKSNTPAPSRRQDTKAVFYPNGAIFIIKAGFFRKHRSLTTKKKVGYLMDEESSVDIDNALDFFIAGKLLERKLVAGTRK